MNKHNIILSLIIGFSVTSLAAFQMAKSKQSCHDPLTFESCVNRLNGGTDSDCEACDYLIDMPEEFALISSDSLAPDTMIAFKSGKTIKIGFKN